MNFEWNEHKKNMQDKIEYTDGEIGNYTIIDDNFLPSPAEFAAVRKKSKIIHEN